jgi:hypothetical protein
MIDLIDVTGKDNLRAFAGARNDRLHLVGSQILSFIDYEEDPLQTAPANVGQRGDQL